MQYYTFYDISQLEAEFAVSPLVTLAGIAKRVGVKPGVVTRGAKTFIRKRHTRGIASKRTSKVLQDLTKETLDKEALPSRRKVLGLLKAAGQDFAERPLAFIREGNQRENLVRDLVKETALKEIPSRQQLVRSSVGKLKNFLSKPEVKRDLVVNTGGFLGSIAGGALAGTPGQWLADLGGALVVRRAVQDYDLTRKVLSVAKTQQAFQQGSFLKKVGIFRNKAITEARSEQMKIAVADDFVADTSGWAVGNITAEATSIVKVPFRGASVALVTVPDFLKAARRIRAGEQASVVAKDTAKAIALKPKVAIDKGNLRERKVREKASKIIKDFKEIKVS